MEPDRIDGFYTKDYHKRLLEYEEKSYIAGRSARYYIYEKGNPWRIIGTAAIRNIVRGSFMSATIGAPARIHGKGICHPGSEKIDG